MSKMFERLQVCIGQLQVMQNVQDKDYQNLCRSIQRLDRQVGHLASLLNSRKGKTKQNRSEKDKAGEHDAVERMDRRTARSSDDEDTSIDSDSSQIEISKKKKPRTRGSGRRRRPKKLKKQRAVTTEVRDSEETTGIVDESMTTPLEIDWTMRIQSFEELELDDNVMCGLSASPFSNDTPTHIQQLALPAMLESDHVTIETAQIGDGLDGKAVAIAIAALQKINGLQRMCQVLVVSSSREAAKQIYRELVGLGTFMRPRVSCHLCVGGTNVRNDVCELEGGVQLVVGTAGRMFDLLRRNAIKLSTLHCVIIDDLDHMLSRGFDRKYMYSMFTELKCEPDCQPIQKILFFSKKTKEVTKFMGMFAGKHINRVVMISQGGATDEKLKKQCDKQTVGEISYKLQQVL